MKSKLVLVLNILIILTISNLGCISANNQNLTPDEEIEDLEQAKVAHVIDGDTIKLTDGRSVRLIGLDTPELNPPDGPIEYYGLQAKKFTKEKLLGETIYLEYGAEKFDEYDRTLAYIYFADGTLFNKQLLKEGYAHLLTIAPNDKYVDSFKKQVKKARRNNRGLWAVREATETAVISWQNTAKHLGEKAVVTGEVVNTYDTGDVIFLNFAENYEETFTAVIFTSDKHKFAVDIENYFLNQQVRIRGQIEEHKGAPEIVIENPTQIIKNNLAKVSLSVKL